ncbi:hypothetical protein SRHO_G00248340 [Serrasalmus rhombeus]
MQGEETTHRACYIGAETREEDANTPRESLQQKKRPARPSSICTWPADGSCRLSSRRLKSTGSSLRNSKWQPLQIVRSLLVEQQPSVYIGAGAPSHYPSRLQSRRTGALLPLLLAALRALGVPLLHIWNVNPLKDQGPAGPKFYCIVL